jgi:hypothetical protein
LGEVRTNLSGTPTHGDRGSELARDLRRVTLRSTVRQVHGAWGDSAIMRGMHLILTNTPFFPVQVVAGAYLGRKFYGRWGHRSMLWVSGFCLVFYSRTLYSQSRALAHGQCALSRTLVHCPTTSGGDAKQTTAVTTR